jgi:polar amino acid transport system substrate-binding protein
MKLPDSWLSLLEAAQDAAAIREENMKIFKTIFLFALALTLLAACAHMSETGGGQASHLAMIQERGELIVGTAGSMPPLNFTSKDGEVMGFEVDLARQMAQAMGVELNIQTMSFAELLPALEAGKVDMILSGMTITPERNLNVAFVGPYLISGKAFLTKMKTIAKAKDPSEVDKTDVSLAALQGSTSQYFVEQFMPNVKLTTARDYDEAVSMVIDDKVDALIADFPICVLSVLRYPDKGLVSLITPLTYEPIGIALPENDPHLVNWVENYLMALEGTGRLDELKEYWFGSTSWLLKLP